MAKTNEAQGRKDIHLDLLGRTLPYQHNQPGLIVCA